MNDYLDTPLLITTFNRPEHLKVLLAVLAQIQPRRLYISSDGPREERTDDVVAVKECRSMIESISWPCEVSTNFHAKNLGMKRAMINAISWFFKEVPEGIILEDDCIPNTSFFEFCSSMLSTYRDDLRIMHISGTNQQFGRKIGSASYYFSSFPAIWGWASWRRVWEIYDEEMEAYPMLEKRNVLWSIMPNETLTKHLHGILRLTYEKKSLTWDHQLAITIIANGGLCVVPNVNLISNIGVPKVSKQGELVDPIVGKVPLQNLDKPYVHPAVFLADIEADINQASWTYDDIDANDKILFRTKAPEKSTGAMDLHGRFKRLFPGIFSNR